MTDKQIIENKNGFYCIEPCCEIKQLKEQLKVKEQECEELKAELELFKTSNQTTIDQLKAENEELKKYEYHYLDKYIQLKQTLEEIREICNKTLCDYLQCSLNYNHSKDFECEKTSCNRAKKRKFILEILQKINDLEI